MNVAGRPYRTIWLKPDDARVVQLIDQRALPHRFVVEDVRTVEQMAAAIREMHVRGAPLIGAAAAYGCISRCSQMRPEEAATILRATRPTAVNLAWAMNVNWRGSRAVRHLRKRLRSRSRRRRRPRMTTPHIVARSACTAWN